MARTMYDSDQASAIPATARMVAGYIDGDRGRWSQADWDRFPNATKVRIVRRDSTNDGDVIDCEEGVVWPPDRAVNWVIMRRLAGAIPSVYCNQLNGLPLVRRAFQDRGVADPPYWVARYNGVEEIPSGTIAKQYANEFLHQQGHFDLSIVADFWPGVDKDKTVADSNTVNALAWRVLSALQMRYNVDLPGATPPSVVNEDIWLTRSIDDMAWRLLSMLELKDTTQGGWSVTAQGKVENLPFVTAFKALVADVAEIKTAMTDIKAAISVGFTLVPEGAITVHAQPRP